jgi:Protein of unknown function (DUF3179)
MRAARTDRRGQTPRRKQLARALAIAAAIAIYPVLSGFDLSHHVVPPAEIRDGGPAKDAIPAVLEPQFVKAEHATFLESNDKVIGVVVQGRARAYPIKILNWHEVVDDSIAGTPLAVTFCPLVQGAAVYNRDAGGKTLTFAVSGKLYQSNLVLYDEGTQSLWSQLEGQALAGPMAGQKLAAIPSTIVTWEAWQKKYPSTDVLSINTGYTRDYGVDPYWGYEHGDQVVSPVAHLDERLSAHELVLGLSAGGQDEAFPLSKLSKAAMPLRVQLGGADLTINYDPDSGAATASVSGERVPVYNGYWFAWAAFHPKTAIWSAAATTTKDTAKSQD